MIFPLRSNSPVYDVPYITLAIILLNCLVFGLELNYPGGPLGFIKVWGDVPVRVWSGEPIPGTTLSAWWTALTCTFVHFDFGHIFGNMLALWIFGPSLEWVCGRFRFLLFYLGAGVFSSLVTVALGYASSEGGAGASGALAGVMAAYLIFYPRAKITSIFFLTWINFVTGNWGIAFRNISAYWYVGSWVAFQVALAFILLAAGINMNLGIYAHASGALAGGLLIWSLHIPERRPGADHHTQSAELTTAIIGDEGDAGDSASNMTDAERLEAWKYTPQGRLEAKIRALRTPFKDTLADSLFASGDLQGVRQHCQEMLDLARRDMNPARIEAYEMLLAEIGQREAEARAAQAAAERAEQVRAALTAPSYRSSQTLSRGSYGLDEPAARGSRRPPPR